jgi:hypothetical protein
MPQPQTRLAGWPLTSCFAGCCLHKRDFLHVHMGDFALSIHHQQIVGFVIMMTLLLGYRAFCVSAGTSQVVRLMTASPRQR